ncbi:MAG TPA: c-type cytochrome [Gaiellaceae bacterium]
MRPALLAALAVAAITAGCGAVNRINIEATDPGVGKTLFNGQGKCASCHTLADAKAQGQIGPNLDDAFGPDKAQGFHISTLADVVRGQIAYPDTDTGTGAPGMTANLLHGQQARDVSVYVAMCAANPKCGVTAKPVGNTPG